MKMIGRIKVVKEVLTNPMRHNHWTVYKNTLPVMSFNELSNDSAASNLREYIKEMEAHYKKIGREYTIEYIDGVES